MLRRRTLIRRRLVRRRNRYVNNHTQSVYLPYSLALCRSKRGDREGARDTSQYFGGLSMLVSRLADYSGRTTRRYPRVPTKRLELGARRSCVKRQVSSARACNVYSLLCRSKLKLLKSSKKSLSDMAMSLGSGKSQIC